MEKMILTDGPCSVWGEGVKLWEDPFGRRAEQLGNRAVIHSAKVRFPQHDGDPEDILLESQPGECPDVEFKLLEMKFTERGRGGGWPTRDRSGSWLKYC